MRKPLQAFIFDLDGVITDTADYHYLAWKKLGARLKIPFTRAFNEQLKGISRMESLDKILANGRKQHEFTEIEKQQLANEKNAYYLQLIKSITPNDILPSVKAFITDIKNHQMKLALASASKNAYTVMAALELIDEFDAIVDAATIKNGKPNPEIFLTAAKLLDVEPQACIGIEDAVAGVEAIKSAGMFAVAVGATQLFPLADVVVHSTSELSFTDIRNSYEASLRDF